MKDFSVIAETNDETVVSEYKPLLNKSTAYQSEQDLEKEFIKMLKEQSYEYVNIHNEEDLILNLRKQLEQLNKMKFSDKEWKVFFHNKIANPNFSIEEKTRIIQEDYRQLLEREDGSIKNITLIDKTNIHNNKLQVINQYEEENGKYKNRYDVTILVNGLPLVHVELKRRGIAIKEAFNQINRYQNDSFWASNGLYDYVQIFVISNGTHTKYYSNTTRFYHIKKTYNTGNNTKKSNSFEFTNFWADAKNIIISDLIDFTRTFFSKHTILNILTKYCVFTSEKMLLVMRPYQIVATEKVINKIKIANNYKKYGSIEAGGYVWHTTGSGKTLTSFKTAKLATSLSFIDKVIFVVDRKDLDYQTMREYDKFEKGAANSNKSIHVLEKQLKDDKSKIIITTIQKLSLFINKNKGHSTFAKHIVLIFDECHRSQFGVMHDAIVKNFKNYYIFGFTGTPIFAINKSHNKGITKTTEQTFGQKLHTYTIVNAIQDKNVLPFKFDYVKTIDLPSYIKDEMVWDIDRESVFLDPRRIELVTKYILEHFNQKTYRNDKTRIYRHLVLSSINSVVANKSNFNFKEIKEHKNINGFNSIFAVSSIEMAKKYYLEFKKQIAANSEHNLKVGLIYSYGVNEEDFDGLLDEENSDDTEALDKSSREFLDEAIKDYNKMFNTSYDTSAERFQNYYKDVSLRLKNKELDILIVVNMFLTGFDAQVLNTLWVDKNLKEHGLIQAFSRTNRILNSIKTHGNIVCFRNLEKNTKDAISIFGDSEASGLILIRNFKEYYNGYYDLLKVYHTGYKEYISQLTKKFPLSNWNIKIKSETENKNFIHLFSQILKLRNILLSFDEFEGKEILTMREFQDYSSKYQDIKDEIKNYEKSELVTINEDVVFETELLKQMEVNIDYILMLIEKMHDKNTKDVEILEKDIWFAISSSPELRSKKQLILNFIKRIDNKEVNVLDEWKAFYIEEKEEKLNEIIDTEKLNKELTLKFMQDSFERGEIKRTGTEIANILPPISRFSGAGEDRAIKKQNVLNKLEEFFKNFYI